MRRGMVANSFDEPGFWKDITIGLIGIIGAIGVLISRFILGRAVEINEDNRDLKQKVGQLEIKLIDAVAERNAKFHTVEIILENLQQDLSELKNVAMTRLDKEHIMNNIQLQTNLIKELLRNDK